MRQLLPVTAIFLSLGFGVNLSLSATETSTTVSETQNQSRTSSSGKDEQSQMAAWMIESAQVAKDYVDGLDRELYAQSWTKGDQLFQHAITQEEWVKALNITRKPLGKMSSRKLKDQRPARDPQGLPKGAYMVVEYESSFENAPEAAELLTLRRGTDGRWRVLTYQVSSRSS